MNRVLAILAVAGLAGTAMAQISIVPSAVPFTDISGSGTSIGAISDDSELNISGAVLTAAGFLGNGLLAGGVDVRVGNNGGIIWNPSGVMDIGWANPNAGNAVNPSMNALSSTIPATDTVNGNGHSNTAGGSRQFLAVLWDDNTPGTGASIRWQVIAGDLYIQWTNQDHFNAAGTGTVTYQAVIRGGVAIGSGQSLVDFVYQDTFYAANQYQNDGGSATIGYADWGVAGVNNVEFGISGGSGNSTTDPAFGGTNMQPKVAGWGVSADDSLPHSVSIIPAPGVLALLGLGGLAAARRRR